MKQDGNARSRKSDSSIVPKKPSNKDHGAPWSAERVEGRESGRRECRAAKQVLNTESVKGKVWTVVLGHNTGNRRNRQRQTPVAAPQTCKARSNAYGRKDCASLPEAGARCGKSARRDLCGGCRVTGIPTATIWKNELVPTRQLDAARPKKTGLAGQLPSRYTPNRKTELEPRTENENIMLL